MNTTESRETRDSEGGGRREDDREGGRERGKGAMIHAQLITVSH